MIKIIIIIYVIVNFSFIFWYPLPLNTYIILNNRDYISSLFDNT